VELLREVVPGVGSAGPPDAHEFPPIDVERGRGVSFSEALRLKRPPRIARHVHMFDADRMIKLAIAKHSPDRVLPAVTAQDLAVQFESRLGHPENSWIRLKYTIADYWTGDEHKIDDQIFLKDSSAVRWVAVVECPRSGRRVHKLGSRLTYRLAYACRRETVDDRASRRARKLCRRLGGDPDDVRILISQSECAGRLTTD
jgi:hypothetical protein